MLSLIVAMAENGVIGRDNSLPWRLPADLKHFRETTMGHPIIMGRKNYQSIGRPLPGRTNIVVTRERDFTAPGCLVVHSIEDALDAAHADTEPFIVGGAELYAQTLANVGRLYLTLVHAEVNGDVRFPTLRWSEWRELSRERHEPDGKHAYAYSFVTMERAA
ncbi:MAG TPA: dihydrofolate reductase [Burkholderiales bacterium]|nr:dihydrofolate reductase [Burkholderiales bacterium]